MPRSMAEIHAAGQHARYPRKRCIDCLYARRRAICESILSVDDLRKRDLLREVQAQINAMEAK